MLGTNFEYPWPVTRFSAPFGQEFVNPHLRFTSETFAGMLAAKFGKRFFFDEPIL